jgi:tRNA(Glu) U13 pseudouridine synthase TruD
MEQSVRWNIKVSRDTDLSLRSYLGVHGMKKGDLSKFIEKAVRSYVFERTVEEIRAQNADTDPDELQAIIDEAVKEARAELNAKRMAAKA